MIKKITLLLFFSIIAILATGCVELSNCKSNTDCTGGTVCINSKCTTLSIYKTLADSTSAPAPDTKKEAVLEVIEMCETENPRFDARESCSNIRTTKYSSWNVCDYTVGPVIWYNMGSCQNCIISCLAQ